MKIEVFQVSPKIADTKYNVDLILEKYRDSDADVCIFPELAVVGYLPKDLLFDESFLAKCYTANRKIISEIEQKAIIFGTILQDGDKLLNVAVVAQNGKIIGISSKKHLPNTGVFSENRYFDLGEPRKVVINGISFGILVCEDTWHDDSYQNFQNVDIFCSINASPFEVFSNGVTKLQKRLDVVISKVNSFRKPFIYCNTIGFYNGIIFDGNSFVINENFTKLASLKESNLVFEYQKDINLYKTYGKLNENIIEEKYNAILFGIREFFRLTKQEKAIIGLSGGADSALVAMLVSKVLGIKNVLCIMMQSRYTSQESLRDAKMLAENVGFDYKAINIQSIVEVYENMLNLKGVALENIQARIRGNILMAFSNQLGGMVIATGNKSEIATGYCTMYGDMCGAFNPIKDLYKTEVFAMMRYINSQNPLIPENIITKDPSAELRDDQKDSDSLPSYEILDKILLKLIEDGASIENFDIEEQYIAQKVYSLLQGSEFKRWQACFGIKVSSKSFQKDDWQFNVVA